MREFADGLDEILVVEEKGPFLETAAQGGALRHGRTRRASSASATSAASALLPAELDLDADMVARAVAGAPARPRPAARLGRGARAPAGRDRRPPGGAADGPARPVLLLRLPAQLARRRRPEGTLVGAGIGCHTMVLLNPRGQGRDHRHHADGRRGRAVDRHGAVHRRPPPRPEPRRRHVPPLRLAGGPRRGGRGREHHLQAALQRARRHDRRPGRSRASWPCPT